VALYRSGRQADALEVFTRTREVLDETLGLEPSVSLRSLHERVLRQDESLGATQVSLPAPTASSGSRRARPESLHDRATNLPTVVRPLIGRDAQLDELLGLLGEVRLLSLIGPGGAGKTALATATAVRAASDYAGGAFGVRLASVDAPGQVPLAVADAIGVPLDGAAAGRDVTERLLGFLERRQVLLLIDNCEHVVDAVAALVDDLLGRCPEVTVLTTSREALAVPQEVQVSVTPLDVAPAGTAAGRVLDFPASQLFVERARSVRPGTVFGEDDLAAIGAIGRALDGIPLALELAAARVSSMSPVEIAGRLQHRFAFLTSGHRTAEARQQTLRATVDWSYALLGQREQRVFDRLSVFQGGWTLTAAESVVGDAGMAAGEVLDTVGRLVAQSMVLVEPGAVTRYRMLETLRQYAAERLRDSGEDEVVAQRHAEHFRDVTLRAEVALRGHGQREALRRLREEQPNIRSAMAWFAGPGRDPDSALLMAGALGLFWHLGRHLEGRELLAGLVGTEGVGPATMARALQAVSIVERPRGCLVHPSPRCEETAAASLALFEDLGDASGAALSRVLLAVEGVTGRDRERAEALLAEAEAQFRADGDDWGVGVIGFVRMETALKSGQQDTAVRVGRSAAAVFRQLDDPWGLSAVLYHLGWGLRQFGRYAEGARVLEEAIDVAASAGLHNTVQWALADLGIAELHQGNPGAARDHFRRAAAASEHVGDGAGEVLADYGHGLLAESDGDRGAARQLFDTARDGFRTLGTPVPEGLARLGTARCDEAEGDLDRAAEAYDEVLAIGRRAGEPGLVAGALEGRARLAEARGDAAAAAALLREAGTLRSEAVRPAPPHERDALARVFGSRVGV
jgi:predicted ATPase/tetratricopeptide (TPR) repeat protein